MAVDPRTLGVGPVYSGRRLQTDTSVPFRETVQATVGYYLDPAFERVRNAVTYGVEPEPGFDWSTSFPDRHSAFASRYAYATNPEHAAEITRAIDESLQRRETIGQSSVGAQLAAELFNPINFIGLPLGGPLMSGGRVAIGRTALRGGAAAAAVEAGLNVGVIQPADPVQTYTESLVNTASVALFGSGFTAMGAVPVARRLNAQQELRDQASRMFSIAQRAQEIGGVDMAAPMGAREARPLGQAEDVQDVNDRYLQELNDLNRELAAVPAGSGEARLIQERIDQANAERQPYAQELFFRSLEEEGINTNDMYRPAQGGDNWFLNWVTTPARRILTADYGAANNSAKRVIAQLAYDSGLQLEMHRAGVTEGLSIFQKSAADLGEFARTNDELLNLWAEDTGAPGIGSSPLAGIDVNATDLARRAQRQGNTQEAWLLEVSRKRLLGEPMTDAQARAADAITRFFESWEAKLIETGQLRTRTNIGRQISRLEREVESLRARLEDADDAGLRTTLQRREDLLEELRFELQNPMVARNEPHLPRFWNIGAVKQNRAQLADILSNWYAENPYIFSFNESTRRWERVELATDPNSIARRVDQTIDNILGENQNKDAEEIFVGSNRASNLRARSLDIPNSLVADFIELNPVALMAAYTRRVSPQYHFQRTFGSNREDLQRKIVNEMRSAGVSQANIQRYVRDFDTLYRRVVGRVVDEPEALNQRAAAVLREATSLTYLGGSGIAAVADMGRVVMENEMPTLARSMQSFFDPVVRATNKRELRIAGGALDMLLGSAHMRVVDDQNYNVISNTTMDKVRNAFFTLNLLGPVTVLGKQFAGMNGAHMLIEYSQRLARNEASPTEIAYLARYGINREMAENIANSPWQTDPNTGLILANTDEWLNTPSFTLRDGTVARINDGQGVEVKGRYQPVVRNEDGSFTVDYDYIERELFPQRSWTEPRSLPQIPNSVRRLRDAQRFDEKPWTGAPYNLPEDAITSERQWLNFLGARDAYLRANETFLNRQRSLLSLSNEEIVRQVGREFNVDRIITDPEIVRDVFSRQSETDLLGYHQYSFVSSRGEIEGGVVYLDLAGIRKYWRRVQRKLEDPRASLDEINDQLITGDIDPVAYQHRRALYENVDQFENANDFAEFLLMHELHHGKIAQGRMSVPEYEARIDDAALAYMRERRKARADASELANAHALQLSQGGAMPEEAFLTPAAYRNFLVQRAIIDNDPSYSFKAIGLDGRKKNDVFLRDIMLDREARRLSEQAARTSEETVRTFRGALNSHVNNVVMSATAMDRPTIMDGVVYLPERYGKLFGLEADPNVPGYVRIENGFIALPLQLYGFALANVNKTVGVMMQGAVRNRLAGVTAMMAMGYMISSIRTPDFVWDEMSPQDRLGRAFDMSGVAALYSDLFYTTLQTSLALGGPNITGGILEPRFPQEPNITDAVTNVTGAASGWTADMVRSAATFASGDYGEGASQFIRNLPFSNLWFLREDVNQLGRYIAN